LNLFAETQRLLFEHAVQPGLYALGLSSHVEEAFEATEWFMWGAIEIALLYAILRPLEAFRPAEAWADRRETRTDVLYTLLHRLGIIPVAFFFLLAPLLDGLKGQLGLWGLRPLNLEDVFPILSTAPLLAFVVYLLVLDLGEYWRHRLQHRFEWWWALHALHHSQRQLSFWSDNRNHLLDDVIGALWLAAIALAIGVPPGQFVLAIIATRMLESLSHANVRLSFGRIGERLLVSPRFHRLHHAIGDGHEGPKRGVNFAVLFPVWDVLFGTADFRSATQPTGIRDQLQGRDYGRGFLSQQWLGVVRVKEALLGARAADAAGRRETAQ
jgi:sterol desaturase/sphingolipid hydroxylase (fatty acid hydroxylase superfamily)